MLVSRSLEEKLDKKLDRKFAKVKSHRRHRRQPQQQRDEASTESSEENLFKKRKKFYYERNNIVKSSTATSRKKRVLAEQDRNQPAEEKEAPLPSIESASQDVKATKAGTKRKPDEDIETLADMYDYRHQIAASTTTTTSTSSTAKSENGYSNGNGSSKVEPYDESLANVYLGGSNNSIATLCNIGNSCYLNSVIYTLRFAPQFMHKLHHLVDDMKHVYQKIGAHKAKSSSLGRNVSGLQSNSGRSWSSKDLVSLNNLNGGSGGENIQKTNRQLATEKLHELYQSLHRNESIDSSESFHAGTLLQAIQDVSSVFEGNQQQDAHELLMCILDSIRETCSSLIKTIRDHPEIIHQNFASAGETVGELTSPPAGQASTNINSSQSLKSIFSRKIRRKDTMKSVSNGVSSPIKETASDNGSVDDETSTTTVVDGNSSSNAKVVSESSEQSSPESSDKINEVIKRLGLDFFCKDFEGITLFTTKCLTCETVTEQKEKMIDIAIPISHDNLAQPIDPQMFFQNSCITREYFRVENHFRCDKCCGYTEAYRSISFEVLPRLLVLHIKRFSGGMEKISTYSPTPFILKCFCNKCYKKKDEEKLHYYKLYSVITHVGATMSVGHYIAYTCSLDIYNEYVNCCYGPRKLSMQSSNNHSNNVNQQMSGGEKNSGLMKKLIYGRSKASSSGDMSKSLSKPINGLSKMMINGIEKLSMNSEKNNINATLNGHTSAPSSPPKTVCTSSNCCGIYVKNFSNLVENYHNSLSQQEKTVTSTTPTNCEETTPLPEDSSLNSNSSSAKNSPLNDINQKTWYMCDDDKIKVMTQKEFEDALSKNQKVMITPYLLFYARFDVPENNHHHSSNT